MRLVWIRWVIQAAVPLHVNRDSSSPYILASLMRSALEFLKASVPLLSTSERRALARDMAYLGLEWIKAEEPSATPLSKALRQEVLYASGNPPRCWICGDIFSDAALSRFNGNNRSPASGITAIIDFMYPRGLNSKDFECHVDHVYPRAAGGGNDLDNLRLACGYCNSIKRESLDIYARTVFASPFDHARLGMIYPPNPYWVCRLLAVDGRCAECEFSRVDGPLRAAPQPFSRYVNPVNLALFCAEHDPLSSERMVSSEQFRRTRG